MRNNLVYLYVVASLLLIVGGTYYLLTSRSMNVAQVRADSPALWEEKIVPTEDVSISIITDTQISSDLTSGDGVQSRYVEDKYADSIATFVQHVLDVQPDFVVHLGDLIEGTDIDRKRGIEELELVKGLFASIEEKVWWAIGNHDLRSVTRRDFQEIYGNDYANTYRDDRENRYVVLDTSYREEGIPNNPLSKDYVPGFVPKETFSWLREVLNTDKNVYVFMHHTPVPVEFTNKQQLRNAGDLRELFTLYRVNAVFSGHIEKRYYGELDGVKYFTLPGIWKNPLYQGAFYDLSIKEGVPDVMMHYINQESSEREMTVEPLVMEGKMVGDHLEERRLEKEDDEDEGGE